MIQAVPEKIVIRKKRIIDDENDGADDQDFSGIQGRITSFT